MRVKYFPYQPHCFAFGGFDMQMINAINAVVEEGVEASKLDIWSRDMDFEILHVWGIGPHNYNIIDWAKKTEKKVVATVLLPYYDTLRLRLSHIKHYFSKSQLQLKYYYSVLDKIVVVNDLQSIVLTKFYNVPVCRIEVIPNIVEERYFEIPSFNFAEKYGINNYVLCTGNICSRKNQYNLALACKNLNFNLVLIGNVLDGEFTYAKKLEYLVNENSNIRWIKELTKASEELVSAYYDCSIFALPSLTETQPISALEATVMKKPVVLLNRKYAHQSFFKGAILCKSPLVKDIEVALQECLRLKNEVSLNQEIYECKAENVASKYKAIYTQICNYSVAT